MNFPQDERRCIDSSYYSTAKTQLLDCLGKIDFSKPDKRDITLLLETLETLFTYVPASSASESSADISLFEHLKMTCAVSSCILNYLNAVNISDYKTTLFDNLEEFYDCNAFLMYSLVHLHTQTAVNEKGIYFYLIQAPALKVNSRAEFLMYHEVQDTLFTDMPYLCGWR